ncbi:MAG: hypothetical protein MK085_04955 [Phycisphaerales bacterium]|nr:hypothetical protein [Phycisphaerales bacterium]
MRIAICTITRRRPEGLARLLRSLEAMEIDDGISLQLIVVENDTPRDNAALECRIPLRHVFEPTLGIPFARNRSIEEGLKEADRLIFLDDDETVEPNWLSRLLEADRIYGSAAITGPALPKFPDNAPGWATRSRIYQPPRHATGSIRPWAFTHNTMIRADVVREGGFRFEESMGFTGGSDKEFFRRIVEAGHIITWTNDAIAWEWYPRDRIRWRWVIQRSYRIGTNTIQAEAIRGFSGRLALVGRASRFGVRGFWQLLRHVLDPATAIARAGWDFGRTAGLITGILGSRYEEYADRRDP